MASALTDSGKHDALNALETITHLSVHNVDAPTDTTTEPSGGDPAYARKVTTWNAAAGGSKSLSGTYVFDIPPGFTVRSVGFWTALSGGTLKGFFDVDDEAFVGQGTYTLLSGSISL